MNEFHKAIRWTWIIILAGIVYSKYTPTYHFTHKGNAIFRGNTLTGRYEKLEYDEWVSLTESDAAREVRLKIRNDRIKAGETMKKMFAEIEKDNEVTGEDPLDFLKELEDDPSMDNSGYRGRGY